MADKILINTIHMPKGCRYLSDKADLKIPDGLFWKNKTGVGLTTLCLQNDEDTIVVVPRLRLLESKISQFQLGHKENPDKFPILLGITGETKKSQLNEYIADCYSTGQRRKLIVTANSLPKLFKWMGKLKNEFRVVVDEVHQTCLLDCSYQSETALKMLSALKDHPHVTYASATAIPNFVLKHIPQLYKHPQTNVVWEESEKYNILAMWAKSPLGAAVYVAKEYKRQGYMEFPVLEVEGKTPTVQSRQMVVFFIRVGDICDFIKYADLKPEEVNIHVADSPENEKKLFEKLGSGFVNKPLPQKGDKIPMFTLANAVAHCGVDMYHEDNPRVFIVSSPRQGDAIDQLSITQIAGRLRIETPLSIYPVLFYNTTMDIRKTKNEIKTEIRKKIDITKELIEQLNDPNISDELRQRNIKMKQHLSQNIMQYQTAYDYYDSTKDKFVFNTFAMVSDLFRGYLCSEMYKNSQAMLHILDNTKSFICWKGSVDDVDFSKMTKLINHLQSLSSKGTTSFENAMKFYINERKEAENTLNLTASSTVLQQYPQMKDYLELLGEKKIKALSYKESNIIGAVAEMHMQLPIKDQLVKRLHQGSEYSISDLTAIVNDVYTQYLPDVELSINDKTVKSKLQDYGFLFCEHRRTNSNGTTQRVHEIMQAPKIP